MGKIIQREASTSNKKKPIVEYDLQEDNNKKREIKYKKDPPKSKLQLPPLPQPQKGQL